MALFACGKMPLQLVAGRSLIYNGGMSERGRPYRSVTATEIHLPPDIRRTAGDRAVVSAEGSTVHSLLNDLEWQFPGMRFHIFHETGELRSHINIFVNSENIRYLHNLETPLRGGEVVHILHAISGG